MTKKQTTLKPMDEIDFLILETRIKVQKGGAGFKTQSEIRKKYNISKQAVSRREKLLRKRKGLPLNNYVYLNGKRIKLKKEVVDPDSGGLITVEKFREAFQIPEGKRLAEVRYKTNNDVVLENENNRGEKNIINPGGRYYTL